MTVAGQAPAKLTVRVRRSLLLVDADPAARQTLRRALESRFKEFAYYESGDGKDAFQKISRQKFDWVIADLKLPKLDGRGLVEALAHLPRDVLPSHIVIRDENFDPTASATTHPIVTIVKKTPDLESLLKIIAEMHAPISTSPAASRLDLTIVHASIESVISAFALVVGVPLKRDRTSVSRESQLRGDIGVQSHFEAPELSIEVALSMFENCYLPIVNRVTQQQHITLLAAGTGLMSELGERVFKGLSERMTHKVGVTFSAPKLIKGKKGMLEEWAGGVRVSTQFQSHFGLATVRLDLKF